MTARVLPFVLLAAAAPLACASAYLGVLAALARVTPPPLRPPRRLRFAIVVPAHDEASGIAATVRSLQALDWPHALTRITVVADNCTDDTAALARAAGAEVIEREDPERRGKGWALARAFSALLEARWADAVVVVDADTVASQNLLEAFAARLEDGASAVQARYGVRNPTASWRTRLMSIAFTLYHDVRSLGRERLGLSAGVRGNGWCVTIDALRRVPYAAFSKVEDVEYGLRLGVEWIRVRYAHDASVLGEMPSTGRAAGTQRRRWEGGRIALAARHFAPLAWRALRRRDGVLFDLAADLAVPPLGTLVTLEALGLAASWWCGARAAGCVFAAGLALLATYVLRGWWSSGTGLRGLLDLALAPLYVVWKLAVALVPSAREGWVRTPREAERAAPNAPRRTSRVDGRRLPVADLRRTWAEVEQRGFGCVAVVPAGAGLSALPVAEQLARLARARRGVATGVRLVDVRATTLPETARIAGEMRREDRAGEFAVLALPPTWSGSCALTLAHAADATLLVVELGRSEISAVRKTVAAIGRENVLGCITVEGGGT